MRTGVHEMTPIYCEIYSCTMAPEACASRYFNAQTSATAPVGNQKCGAHDPNCRVCKAGKVTAKAVGREGVDEYRKSLIKVKNAARVRAMAAAKTRRINVC